MRLRADPGRRLAQQTHQRLSRSPTCRAGSADDAEAFAALDMEADAAHGLHEALVLAEAHGEILDFDERHRLSGLREQVRGSDRPPVDSPCHPGAGVMRQRSPFNRQAIAPRWIPAFAGMTASCRRGRDALFAEGAGAPEAPALRLSPW